MLGLLNYAKNYASTINKSLQGSARTTKSSSERIPWGQPKLTGGKGTKS